MEKIAGGREGFTPHTARRLEFLSRGLHVVGSALPDFGWLVADAAEISAVEFDAGVAGVFSTVLVIMVVLDVVADVSFVFGEETAVGACESLERPRHLYFLAFSLQQSLLKRFVGELGMFFGEV